MHLKSKINRRTPFDPNGELRRHYVEEAIKPRIKLATEAVNVRSYLEARIQVFGSSSMSTSLVCHNYSLRCPRFSGGFGPIHPFKSEQLQAEPSVHRG